jgi:DNA-binding protein HU-beta
MAATKKTMTKSQIIAHFAEKFSMPKKTAAEVVDSYAELAMAQTKKIGAFVMPGIGKLVLSKRKARMGRNPKTGEPMQIAAKTVVKARLAKAFKDSIVPPKKK